MSVGRISAAPSGKGAYLNHKHLTVQALRDLLEEHRNFVKHGGIGLVTRHFGDIFQLFNLANHLPETLIVVHQQPDAAVFAALNR